MAFSLVESISGGGGGGGGIDYKAILSSNADNNLIHGINALSIFGDADIIPLPAGVSSDGNGIQCIQIELKTDCSVRRPVIALGAGVTINGETNNLILTGGQGDEYLLVGAGDSYTLIAQGSSPFEFEGVTSGSVTGVSINSNGLYFGSSGTYTATQASTSGVGSGAEFEVTISGNELTAVDSITSGGSVYNVGDFITLEIAGSLPILPAVLLVTATT